MRCPAPPPSQSISLGGWAPTLRQASAASTSTSTSTSRARSPNNVLGDVAMAKDEVKARLAPIPVYTVANPKNEFVLVAGEVTWVEGQAACGPHAGRTRTAWRGRTQWRTPRCAAQNNTQLGFFFLKREDAVAIVEKVRQGPLLCTRAVPHAPRTLRHASLRPRAQIREENPRLARDSKILRVTMDNVYEVFTTPRDQTGLQGIHFRFMPDMKQVSMARVRARMRWQALCSPALTRRACPAQVAHALELYKEAGVPTRSFVGVPVFQAEGLTVTTQEMVGGARRSAVAGPALCSMPRALANTLARRLSSAPGAS